MRSVSDMFSQDTFWDNKIVINSFRSPVMITFNTC